jgi:hypothetical protein
LVQYWSNIGPILVQSQPRPINFSGLNCEVDKPKMDIGGQGVAKDEAAAAGESEEPKVCCC